MEIGKELGRPDSGCCRVLAALEREGKSKQAKLAGVTGLTIGAVCKCLQLLVAEGYVRRREGDECDRAGMSGRYPALYERTARQRTEQPVRPVDVGAPLPALSRVVDSMIRGCA